LSLFTEKELNVGFAKRINDAASTALHHVIIINFFLTLTYTETQKTLLYYFIDLPLRFFSLGRCRRRCCPW